MVDIWITGCTHGWHKNITKGVSKWSNTDQCRPFDDENLMTNHVVKNINDCVHKADLLIHLGDWSFGGYENIFRFREMINCENIIICRGNHDYDKFWHKKEVKSLFKEVYSGLFEKSIGSQRVILCHYPILSWNHKSHGSYMLHSHCHGSMRKWVAEHMPNSKILDCGVDTNDLKPYNFSDIVNYMNNKTEDALDHHSNID